MLPVAQVVPVYADKVEPMSLMISICCLFSDRGVRHRNEKYALKRQLPRLVFLRGPSRRGLTESYAQGWLPHKKPRPRAA